MGLTGWRLVSLIGAALLGGYALASAVGIFLAAILPASKSDAVLLGNLVSFAVYVAAIMWVCAVRKPLRAWCVLLITALILAGLCQAKGVNVLASVGL
ncbi:DUF3649 domain-containing protein [uncultured Gilvimarinus sp.]|uniref:DUF3649 domain-containing protein n=1 Tax=uncultured Gilvimarinus sp. TaxID=1689143 RepID=UPI0030EF9B59|tara:strand:- start:1812 stop:2105 length:294 start_codon:yes stop_codon:yes gene_type:complete